MNNAKYNTLKLFHIIGIVVWLGPSTGAYYMVLFAHLSEQHSIELWLRQQYLPFIQLETAGLLVLLSSGVLMIIASQWTLLNQWWLKAKVFTVISVFIPLELIQLYLYRSALNSAFNSGSGLGDAIWLFDRFSVIAIAVLTIAVPLVLFLSVFKPDRT
jgi:uncharacterized membrane protein